MEENNQKPVKFELSAGKGIQLTGASRILTERYSQQTKNDRTVEQDVELNTSNQLPLAASYLSLKHPFLSEEDALTLRKACLPDGWDKEIWEHMCEKSYVERLAIAGSLIAAEIDRELKIQEDGENID